jgi:hypothetical protein
MLGAGFSPDAATVAAGGESLKAALAAWQAGDPGPNHEPASTPS